MSPSWTASRAREVEYPFESIEVVAWKCKLRDTNPPCAYARDVRCVATQVASKTSDELTFSLC